MRVTWECIRSAFRNAARAHVTRIGYTFINVRVIARIPIRDTLYNFIQLRVYTYRLP